MPETTIIYTDAPVEYDYGGTTNHGTAGHHNIGNGGTMRRVEIEGDGRYQRPRYGSGLYVDLTQDRYDEWIENGDITPLSIK